MGVQLLMAAILKRELCERGIGVLSLSECQEIIVAVFDGSARIEPFLRRSLAILPPHGRA
jgi:hypothetical protein